MSDATLTREEVIRITGRRRKSAQCKWLRDNGIKFKPNALGHPQIGRAYYDQLAGAGSTRRQAAEPDWSALNRSKR